MGLGGLFRTTREVGKHLAFTGYATAIAPVRTHRLAEKGLQRVSVLCYHRVNDALRDNVTLPVETFDAQMAFIRRHYQLVSIGDIVAGRLDRASRFPIVAVTFDDGYRDNYENAFPILVRYGVPATFFVATGKIGSDEGFDHDRQKLGYAVPTMSWDHLRELWAEGFEIGAHTVNHSNLTAMSDEDADRELALSRDAIRGEIGVSDVPFAYCYGRRADITPARRAQVKAAGYTCCCATYGGTNDGPLDLFDIKRFGVNWAASPAAFKARIEGFL
jgi:peptidoglycan/xylan/chitin deacetylase (PgdA/CDA1 family)